MYLYFLSFLCLLPTTLSFAGLGHTLTGVIANQLLTSSQREFFQQYIDVMSKNYSNIATFGEAARWSDDVRTQTYLYDYWHYRQGCYSADNMTRCSKVSSPNSYTVINDAINVIKNSSKIENKGFYFLFLLHLIGDIHQPLHNIRLFNAQYPKGDSGGNAIPIAYQGITSNLHEFWDNLCIMKPVNPSRPFTKYPLIQKAMETLASQYIANYTFAANETQFSGDISTVEAWINQSYNLAVKYAYEPHVVSNGNLTDSYAKQCRSVLDKQLALAGRRIASVLSYLYNFLNKN